MQKNIFFALLMLLSAAFGTTASAAKLSPASTISTSMNTSGGKGGEMGTVVVKAGQVVTLHLALQNGETATLNVYDQKTGSLLSSQEVKAQKGLTEVNIPTRVGKTGTFIVEATTESTTAFWRVLVQ